MTSERTLIVLRHAKTESGRPGGHDFERRLTEHGERQARDVGDYFRDQNIGVDHVLCSSSTRTRATLEALALPDQIEVEISDQLYNAGTDTLLEAVMGLPPNCFTALVIGHAPSVPGLVYELCDPFTSDSEAFAAIDSRFPPATLARIAVTAGQPEGNWLDIGSGRLVAVRLR